MEFKNSHQQPWQEMWRCVHNTSEREPKLTVIFWHSMVTTAMKWPVEEFRGHMLTSCVQREGGILWRYTMLKKTVIYTMFSSSLIIQTVCGLEYKIGSERDISIG